MASPGKKVVPIFLAILIAVGTALYLGMLSYRPEVVDEPTSTQSDAPPDAPPSVEAPTGERDSPTPAPADDEAEREPGQPANDNPAEETAPPSVDPSAEPNTDGDADTDEVEEADAAPSPERPPPDAPPTGMLDKETIQDGIRAVTPYIKACFEEGLKQDPSLAGRVVVSFEIEAEEGEGRITRGEVKEAETQSLFFEACVLREVAKARFDAPRGGGKVSVTYPFSFDPGGGWGGEVPDDPTDDAVDAEQ